MAGCAALATTGGPASKKPSYAPFPEPDSGYVSDHADLLTIDEEEQIERWLWQIESRTGVEIIIVVVDSIARYPGTPNQDVESFAGGLFDAYGIGNMPANDGVLLLVAHDDRRARIELGAGYGHGRDGDARKIMDRAIVPRFREGDYAGGIQAGTKAVAKEFAGVRIGPPWMLIGLLATLPVLGLIAFSLFKNGKRGWGWVVVGLMIVVILLILFIVMRIVRHMPRESSSGWSAGGLGGFGGGSSGGGGATGSW
ncbi:MAG: TPM domain-containing protein [bacterium]|nr:TPM domain-containing protein [bacterium]